MDAQGIGHVAKVRRNANLDAVRRQREPHRIGRIVRDRKARNIEIANCETAACLEALDHWIAFAPVDIRGCSPRQVNRNSSLRSFADGGKPACMIRMLVRNQNGVEAVDVFADCGKSACDFAPAEPGIDQDARTGRAHEYRVAGTAACQDAELKNEPTSEPAALGGFSGYTTGAGTKPVKFVPAPGHLQ